MPSSHKYLPTLLLYCCQGKTCVLYPCHEVTRGKRSERRFVFYQLLELSEYLLIRYRCKYALTCDKFINLLLQCVSAALLEIRNAELLAMQLHCPSSAAGCLYLPVLPQYRCQRWI